jgi:hypothetical protein
MSQRKKRFVNNPDPIVREDHRTFKKKTLDWLSVVSIKEATILLTISGIALLFMAFAGKRTPPGSFSFFDIVLAFLGMCSFGVLGALWTYRQEMYGWHHARDHVYKGPVAVIFGVITMVLAGGGALYFLYQAVEKLILG